MSGETHALIKAFEEKGYRVVIQHNRATFSHPVYGRILKRNGGRTLAIINKVVDMDEKGKRNVSYASFTGLAYCSKKDSFCKKKGANIALKRAATAWKKHYTELPESYRA